MIRSLRPFVCIGGITSFTLTFFHPVMWAPVGLALGIALLLLVPHALSRDQAEPPGFFLALIWIVTTALLALTYGLTENLFNIKQVGLMLAGLLFGYFLSVSRAPAWAAWAPFALFVLYTLSLIAAGRPPAEAFPRNSENYVSVILLALFASALLLTRPPSVRPAHVLTALLILALSIWGVGRGGILASLLLASGLFLHMITRGGMGVIRATVVLVMLLLAAGAMLAGAAMLESQGYLDTFAGRGLHDASRLSILLFYFQGIEPLELVFGRNYYDESFMERWRFNLHNSYLSAWAHLGLHYLLFVLGALTFCVRRLSVQPVIVIAVLAFAVRALTDTHLISGQYDYVLFATLFMLLREHRRRPLTVAPAASPA
ncbi:hypothetical protein BH24PSE2_BH24PSE2_03000 [soil metagenome]